MGKFFRLVALAPIFYSKAGNLLMLQFYLVHLMVIGRWKRFFKLPKKFGGKLGNIKNAFQCPKRKTDPKYKAIKTSGKIKEKSF